MQTTETRKTGGQLLVECVLAQGARAAFGVPGESYLAILDALYDVREQLEFVVCRQEGGAAFMAEAWGKLTGEPGLCFVTRGPGATNASIGVHTAMQDSTPMILFVGQVGTKFKGREAFQEIDYRAFFGPVAKWVTEIDQVDRVPEIVARAYSVARSGRPGPVVIALPEDMLTSTSSAQVIERVRISEPSPGVDEISRVVELLEAAEKTLLLIGGGGWRSAGRSDLKTLVEASDLPVVTAFRFHDLFDNFHRCFAGEAGVGMRPSVRALLENADVILAIGVRFGEMTTDGYTLPRCPTPAQQVIHVHASDAELGKVYQVALPVHAGPNRFVAALADRSLATSGARADWCKNARDAFLESLVCPPQPDGVDMGEISAWLRANLPDDVIVTHGAGNFTVWPNKYLLYGEKARLLGPQSGAMGYGLPAAIAAKVADRTRTVVCFAGDGDLQMNCQELGTAMQAGAQPIVLVLNNGMYGTIRMHQEHHYPARISGTQLANPDFVGLAQAYGFHAERIERSAEFADAFARAQASNTGALLELMIGPESLTPTLTVAQARR